MTLSILWFILIAVLWTVYLVLEGFDFGVGMLLPLVAKDDRERTQTVRTIGPHWDGNEVWLLTAGGATFAAFPEWYATMFSGMYLALFLVLVCLIVRVVALEWRSKIAAEKWRRTWDWIHTASAWLVPLLLGVAFANFVQGMMIEVVDQRSGMVVDPTAVASSLATERSRATSPVRTTLESGLSRTASWGLGTSHGMTARATTARTRRPISVLNTRVLLSAIPSPPTSRAHRQVWHSRSFLRWCYLNRCDLSLPNPAVQTVAPPGGLVLRWPP